MAETFIKIIPARPIKLNNFSDRMKPQLAKGLMNAGLILEGGWKQMVDHAGFTKDPQRTSKYWGICSGVARQGIARELGSDGYSVRVGPAPASAKYVAVQEHGARITQVVTRKQQRFLAAAKQIYVKVGSTLHIKVPARPVRPDLWGKKSKACIKAITNALTEPLR